MLGPMQLQMIFLIIPIPGCPIMPGLECIDILEKHFIYNMWNVFYVCVVQSRLQGRYSFKNIMTIIVRLSNEEKFLIILLMSYDM
jgi:hypothetical protein